MFFTFVLFVLIWVIIPNTGTFQRMKTRYSALASHPGHSYMLSGSKRPGFSLYVGICAMLPWSEQAVHYSSVQLSVFGLGDRNPQK